MSKNSQRDFQVNSLLSHVVFLRCLNEHIANDEILQAIVLSVFSAKWEEKALPADPFLWWTVLTRNIRVVLPDVVPLTALTVGNRIKETLQLRGQLPNSQLPSLHQFEYTCAAETYRSHHLRGAWRSKIIRCLRSKTGSPSTVILIYILLLRSLGQPCRLVTGVEIPSKPLELSYIVKQRLLELQTKGYTTAPVGEFWGSRQTTIPPVLWAEVYWAETGTWVSVESYTGFFHFHSDVSGLPPRKSKNLGSRHLRSPYLKKYADLIIPKLDPDYIQHNPNQVLPVEDNNKTMEDIAAQLMMTDNSDSGSDSDENGVLPSIRRSNSPQTVQLSQTVSSYQHAYTNTIIGALSLSYRAVGGWSSGGGIAALETSEIDRICFVSDRSKHRHDPFAVSGAPPPTFKQRVIVPGGVASSEVAANKKTRESSIKEMKIIIAISQPGQLLDVTPRYFDP